MLAQESIQQLRDALSRAFPGKSEAEREDMLKELQKAGEDEGARPFIQYHHDCIAKIGVRVDYPKEGRRRKIYFATEANKEYLDF